METERMDAPLSHAKQALRDAGYKLTTPRLTILDILEENGGHLTSTTLLHLVEVRDSTIGRASVFRTLDLLARLGIVASTVQGATINYVLMASGHHHHMVCTRCQKVIEFADCRLDETAAMLHSVYGFQPEGHLLEVYGVCRECQSNPPPIEA